ncbi:MAG TPA: preprotein translocase subunit TatB [Desulfobacteraceae bacterium]|nr:preprotein translocase subunit TatB [Desulfobacteraceae bacterium]
MSKVIDARGLSCPQPVILTINEIKKQISGEILILVDTDTARENVGRAADSQGWQVKNIQKEDDGYQITIIKD